VVEGLAARDRDVPLLSEVTIKQHLRVAYKLRGEQAHQGREAYSPWRFGHLMSHRKFAPRRCAVDRFAELTSARPQLASIFRWMPDLPSDIPFGS
jgi:hypothetical protein